MSDRISHLLSYIAISFALLTLVGAPPPPMDGGTRPDEDMTTCQRQHFRAVVDLINTFEPITQIPRCDAKGNWQEVQCIDQLGLCYCVNTTTGDKTSSPNPRPISDCAAENRRPMMESRQVCPNGNSPKFCSAATCLTTVCPVAEDIHCRVDPCQDCRPTFYKSDGSVITNCRQDASICGNEVIDVYESVISDLKRDPHMFKCTLDLTLLKVTGKSNATGLSVPQPLRLMELIYASFHECDLIRKCNMNLMGRPQPPPPQPPKNGDRLPTPKNGDRPPPPKSGDRPPPPKNGDRPPPPGPPPPGQVPKLEDIIQIAYSLKVAMTVFNISTQEDLVDLMTAELKIHTDKLRPGRCPMEGGNGTMNSCTKGDDTTCGGVEKCCPSGGMHKCIEPLIFNVGVAMPSCRAGGDRTHGGYNYKQCFSAQNTYCGCVDASGKLKPGTMRLGGNVTCDSFGLLADDESKIVACPANVLPKQCKSSCQKDVECKGLMTGFPICLADVCDCSKTYYVKPHWLDVTKGALSSDVSLAYRPATGHIKRVLREVLDHITDLYVIQVRDHIEMEYNGTSRPPPPDQRLGPGPERLKELQGKKAAFDLFRRAHELLTYKKLLPILLKNSLEASNSSTPNEMKLILTRISALSGISGERGAPGPFILKSPTADMGHTPRTTVEHLNCSASNPYKDVCMVAPPADRECDEKEDDMKNLKKYIGQEMEWYYFDHNTGTCKQKMLKNRVCMKGQNIFTDRIKCMAACKGKICPGNANPTVCPSYVCNSTTHCEAMPRDAICAIDPCTCKPVFYNPATREQINCKEPIGLCQGAKAIGANFHRNYKMSICTDPTRRPQPPPPKGGNMPRPPPPKEGDMKPPPPKGRDMEPPPPKGRDMEPPPPPKGGDMQRPPPKGGDMQRPPPKGDDMRPGPPSKVGDMMNRPRGIMTDLQVLVSDITPEDLRCQGKHLHPKQCIMDRCWCVNPLGQRLEPWMLDGKQTDGMDMECPVHDLDFVNLKIRLNGTLAKIKDLGGFKTNFKKALSKHTDQAIKDEHIKIKNVIEGSIIVETEISKFTNMDGVLNHMVYIENVVQLGKFTFIHEGMVLVANPEGTEVDVKFVRNGKEHTGKDGDTKDEQNAYEPKKDQGLSYKTKVIIIVLVCVFVGLVLIGLIFACCRKKSPTQDSMLQSSAERGTYDKEPEVVAKKIRL